jgi:hypothetical protein
MEKFPNEVHNILTKGTFYFLEVKHKFLNLHSAGSDTESAHHSFGNKKNKKSKNGTKFSNFSSSNPSLSFSKDVVFTIVKPYTWCTNHHLSQANGHGWHIYSKMKESNKSVQKIREKGKEQDIAKYNSNTDVEVEGLSHQDAELSTTAKWISGSGASTYKLLDIVIF